MAANRKGETMATRKQAETRRSETPFCIVNVSCIGRRYGRFATEAEAKAEVERQGGEYLGTDGHEVKMSAPVYC